MKLLGTGTGRAPRPVWRGIKLIGPVAGLSLAGTLAWRSPITPPPIGTRPLA